MRHRVVLRLALLGSLIASACDERPPAAARPTPARDGGPRPDASFDAGPRDDGGPDAGPRDGGTDGGVDGGCVKPTWCVPCEAWCTGEYDPGDVFMLGRPLLEPNDTDARALLQLPAATGVQRPILRFPAGARDLWITRDSRVLYLEETGTVRVFAADGWSEAMPVGPTVQLLASAVAPDARVLTACAGVVEELWYDPSADAPIVGCALGVGDCAPTSTLCAYQRPDGTEVDVPLGWRIRQVGFGGYLLLRDTADGALAIYDSGTRTLRGLEDGGVPIGTSEILGVRTNATEFRMVRRVGGQLRLEAWPYERDARTDLGQLQAPPSTGLVTGVPEHCAIAVAEEAFCAYRYVPSGSAEQFERVFRHTTTSGPATTVYDGASTTNRVKTNPDRPTSPLVTGVSD